MSSDEDHAERDELKRKPSQSQADLKKSQSDERFRQLTETINEVFWMEDLEGNNLIYVSPAFEKIWGIQCEEFYQNTQIWLDSIHPEDRERVKAEYPYDDRKNIIAGKYKSEFRIVRPDGSIRWILDQASPVFNEKGVPIRIAGIATDITKLKLTEESLRNSEERIRLITDSLPVLISYIDTEYYFRFNNKGYEDWFELSKNEIYGKHVKEILGKKAYDLVKKYFDRALAGDRVAHETNMPYKHGDDRYIHADFIPDIGKQGKVKGFFALVTDITEIKKNEQELKDHQVYLEELVKQRTIEINKKNLELKQKNIALNEVIAEIEIRKKQIEDSIIANYEKILLPLIKKIRKKMLVKMMKFMTF
jgi:PAS domain S-box-containing protein